MSLTDRIARRVEIVVRLDALQSNLAALKRCCPTSKVFAVLKSDAYGHGAVDCARVLSAADGIAVAHPDEAIQLRDAGITQPVLVLQGAANLAETQRLAERNCMLVLHQHEQCLWIEEVAQSTPVTVWIKTDTGMGRLGFGMAETQKVVQNIGSLNGVSLGGLMSHLASADETGRDTTRKQLDAFAAVSHKLPGVPTSLANSAAVLAWPDTHQNWVRPGIALYGANPLDVESPIALRPVMEVTAPLIAIRQMRRGDGIGYGSDYHCPEDMKVGVIAIGYGDGLPRVLNGAEVSLAGYSLPIIGRVSMDSIVVDLRRLKLHDHPVTTGDKVLLWGENLPVEGLAAAAGTISYELLCSIRGVRRSIPPN